MRLNVPYVFRSEFKANHAEWVNTVKPNLGPGIRERVQEAIASEDESAMDDLHAVRTEFKSALATLLKVNSYTVHNPIAAHNF
jgi:amidase